jgi:uncharacterized protein (TIGR00255 family)
MQMVLSMTGFGKTTCEMENKRVTIEIKSLNSKQLDLSTRIPSIYREKEMELRNIISQKLERGKIELSIFVENIGKECASQLNTPIIESYYNQIMEVSQQLQMTLPVDWFATLLRLPDAMKSDMQEIKEEEWKSVRSAFMNSLDQLITFRKQEGNSLQRVFETKLSNIKTLLAEVEPHEKERIEKVRSRISESLSNLKDIDYDKNRFEQELIYYIEKLDINEEKSRLAHHLSYFLETMNESAPGKKLGFIAQEIGREINTLGSKSNHSEMQKIVVKMKDELEQIKEQVLNVL